ncbi:hypothetical protein [Actinomadura alba]|uniref:Uncharacterized protein n=1 Tax=Actinomadura alba TaxID=406431 RepID=A0ABR7LMH0_9ACTN|nr:hypothetical protein [Actinomadura alba]MBC6465984.1 hypothetical protein [Actinomadura alba]
MSDDPATRPDEDALTIPSAWKRQIHPRRGGTPGPKIKLGAGARKAMRACLANGRGEVERAIADPRTDPDLVAPTRSYLDGTLDPLGAAVAAVVSAGIDAWSDDIRFVDGWTFTHGVAFAACAFTEMATLYARFERTSGRVASRSPSSSPG